MVDKGQAKPSRPALRYYGGKWSLAPWIISRFPKHEHYVEPCFGAGSVLLQKTPVKLETVNDTNDRIVNFFSVLRNVPDALIRAVELTPWSEVEYDLCQLVADDPVEDARRFYAACWMSIHGGPIFTGWRNQLSANGRAWTPPKDFINHDLHAIANRLRNVQIMNRDAVDLIRSVASYSDVLIYFDPPYLKENRTHKKGYGEHDQGDEFHVEAAHALNTIRGYAIVSGYRSDLYEAVYERYGWRRHETTSRGNSGTESVECVWVSPRTWRALNEDGSGLPLFDREVRV